jgi:hypothetical protein
MRMSCSILPNQRAEIKCMSQHLHATPGAMHSSPTQEACLYFQAIIKLCVCFRTSSSSVGKNASLQNHSLEEIEDSATRHVMLKWIFILCPDETT